MSGIFNQIPSASGAADSWDTITAAAANATTNNADFKIVYNTEKTSNDVAWDFRESTAATNGTSTGGVPNQIGMKLSTLAASTMSPLSVYSRGSHVFSVSPSAAQVLFASGTTSAPSISNAANTNIGFSFGTNLINVNTRATNSYVQTRFQNDVNDQTTILILDGAGVASGDSPALGLGSTTSGLFANNSLFGVKLLSVEQLRWVTGYSQYSYGSADAVAYAFNVRKSRGTVAVPTVLATGDALYTISGYGYTGAGETYQEGTRIRALATGSQDSANGLNGEVQFWTMATGNVIRERVAIKNQGWLTMGEVSVDPQNGDMPVLASVSIYMKNDKLVIAYASTNTVMNFITIPMDGSTTAWTHNATPP